MDRRTDIIMNSFVAAVAFLAVFTVAQAALDKEKSLALLKKCKDETKASEDPESIFTTQVVPETPEGKCMMACVMKNKGLMKDGKMDGKAVSEFFEKTYSDEPEKLEKAAEAVAACTVLDVKGKDECETAYVYLKCGKEKGFHL